MVRSEQYWDQLIVFILKRKEKTGHIIQPLFIFFMIHSTRQYTFYCSFCNIPGSFFITKRAWTMPTKGVDTSTLIYLLNKFTGIVKYDSVNIFRTFKFYAT